MTAFSSMILYGNKVMPMLAREELPEKINKQTLLQLHIQQSCFLQTARSLPYLINIPNLQNHLLRAVYKHAGFACIKTKNNSLSRTAI